MASQLKNVLSFNALVVGVPTPLPHGLNWQGLKVIPDICSLTSSGYTVTADNTNVTVTRGAAADANVQMLVESWHTFERAFGDVANHVLSPQPIIIEAVGTGGGGGGGNSQMFKYTANGTEPPASAPFLFPIARADNNYGVVIGLGDVTYFVGTKALTSTFLTTGFSFGTTGQLTINDILYFSDAKRQAFVPLDAALHRRIQAGEIKL